MAAALALGAAACGSDSAIEEGHGSQTPQTPDGTSAHAEGTLIVETVDWVKAARMPAEITEYEPVVDDQYPITSTFDQEYLEIQEMTDAEITVLVHGSYLTADGIQSQPVFTLSDGQSVTFETASEDAGTIYTLTYEK